MKLAYGSKYKNLYITQDEAITGTPKFPTVLMRQIGAVEAGKDIAGDTINAIRPTFQVTINYQGESQSDREALVNMTATAINFFKWKRFEISNPVYTITNKIRTATFRATRTIGSLDPLQ
jgi:hypothetical protein